VIYLSAEKMEEQCIDFSHYIVLMTQNAMDLF